MKSEVERNYRKGKKQNSYRCARERESHHARHLDSSTSLEHVLYSCRTRHEDLGAGAEDPAGGTQFYTYRPCPADQRPEQILNAVSFVSLENHSGLSLARHCEEWDSWPPQLQLRRVHIRHEWEVGARC